VISATAAAIDIRGVGGAAPQAVYQSERQGPSVGYDVPGLTPGGAYTVRLHFAEIDGAAPGQRTFNVAIQATPVLTGFDIAAAVGANHAVVETFAATADSHGRLGRCRWVVLRSEALC